jgi:hypothetical protein
VVPLGRTPVNTAPAEVQSEGVPVWLTDKDTLPKVDVSLGRTGPVTVQRTAGETAQPTPPLPWVAVSPIELRPAIQGEAHKEPSSTILNDAGELLERLCALLIEMDETTAQRVSKNLALLALAPDSASTVKALRSDMKKASGARMQREA